MNISGNGSRINVDMDNLCIWSKFMKFTCGTVVKRVPIEKSRSQLVTAIFAAYASRAFPRFPIKRGCFVEIAPRPMTVVTTGT